MPEILNIERLRDPELDKLARSTDLEGALLAVKHLERRASPLRDKAFDDLLRARTTAPKVRRTIATICGKRATPQNHALLGLALADPDGVVVRNAAKAIGQIGTLAELTRLEALPRQAAEVQASVDFAKSLLSYRHRLGKYRQPVPAAASIVGLRGGFELAAGSVGASKSALAEATRDLPGIGLAAHGGALLECHGVKILIAFTDTFPDPGAIGSLGSLDARPLVIMHAGLSVDRFVLSQHIVTHPGENGAIELLGLRPGGALTYAGRVRLVREGVAFEIRSVGGRYSAAIDFAGTYSPRTGAWTFERKLSSEQVADPSRKTRTPQAL